jgi:hypothetical protein
VYKIGDRIRIRKNNSLFLNATGRKGKIFEIDEYEDYIMVELESHPTLLMVSPIEIEKIT